MNLSNLLAVDQTFTPLPIVSAAPLQYTITAVPEPSPSYSLGLEYRWVACFAGN